MACPDVAQSDVCGHRHARRTCRSRCRPDNRIEVNAIIFLFFSREKKAYFQFPINLNGFELILTNMTACKTNAAPVQIDGKDCERFVARAALLNLIDPVRGDAIRTLLDENPESDSSSGHQLKQKFLDSFALICSTSRFGKETASAVCLEHDATKAAILRVSRNRGLTSKDLTGLEDVLKTLGAVARKGSHLCSIRCAILTSEQCRNSIAAAG